MFSKRREYFYDFEGTLEPHDHPFALDCLQKAQQAGFTGRPAFNPFDRKERQAKGIKGMSRAEMGMLLNPNGKNGRDVWPITPSREATDHTAVMPIELAERCIKAATRPGDLVLDPFAGSATTGMAAVKLGRRFLGIELIRRFVEDSRQRLASVTTSHAEYRISPSTAAHSSGHPSRLAARVLSHSCGTLMNCFPPA